MAETQPHSTRSTHQQMHQQQHLHSYDEVKKRNEELGKHQVEQRAVTNGKPTPTQEECDLARLGQAPDSLEPDGSTEVVLSTTPVAVEGTPASASSTGQHQRPAQGGQQRNPGGGGQPQVNRAQLDAMTKTEVQAEAERRGVSIQPGNSKAEMIDAILQHSK
jgi:hypothetical protein